MNLSTKPILCVFSRCGALTGPYGMFLVFRTTDNDVDAVGDQIITPYNCIHYVIDPFSPSEENLPAVQKLLQIWDEIRQSKIDSCRLDGEDSNIMQNACFIPHLGDTCFRKCTYQISIGHVHYVRIIDQLKRV